MVIKLEPLYRPCALVLDERICAHVIRDERVRKNGSLVTISKCGDTVDLTNKDGFDAYASNGSLDDAYYDMEHAAAWLEQERPDLELHQISRFSGELSTFSSDRAAAVVSKPVQDATLLWIEPKHEISYTERAYWSEDCIIEELASYLKDTLPDDFPYPENIWTIYGIIST